ncbi:hypothetical protein E2C01_008563 [Portunus trituberculatus]|uniref:Uncharacterized protein n=1 Tax=Portunus trituberculatus TaxID=210409 RepID=A0A5B7D3G6_PORTR|nr:hypothetical protein [Portunus trituberculatus]
MDAGVGPRSGVVTLPVACLVLRSLVLPPPLPPSTLRSDQAQGSATPVPSPLQRYRLPHATQRTVQHTSHSAQHSTTHHGHNTTVNHTEHDNKHGSILCIPSSLLPYGLPSPLLAGSSLRLAPDIVVDDEPAPIHPGYVDQTGKGTSDKIPIVLLQGFFQGPGARSPHHRRPSMSVNELTLPPHLVDVTSVIRGALPVLPRSLAALCLTLNILLPGLGEKASLSHKNKNIMAKGQTRWSKDLR